MKEILAAVRKRHPLVHCMTNYVTVNDCANILLAAGAAPIMAEAAEEIDEIVALAGSLCVNIGTLDARTVPVMQHAAQRAQELGRPVVLDPVGAGASRFRTATAMAMLESGSITLVRGNISEIRALAGNDATTRETDAVGLLAEDELDDAIEMIREMARRFHCLIGVSGPIDIVVGDRGAAQIHNGHPIMPTVTGTGCMLSALCAAYLASGLDPFDSVASAFHVMGTCGELAVSRMLPGESSASWRVRFLDAIATLSPDELERSRPIVFDTFRV